LGSNLKEIRAILPYMGYESPGIHCLDIQPGVGKTHAVMDFLKIEENFIVVTGTHKLLKGEYERLKAEHWKNFDTKCEIYSKVKKLRSHNVPIRLICDYQGCDKNKCPYWKQFDTAKAIAPYNYLSTDRVTEDFEFKFNMLVLDEAMTGYNRINIDIDELNEIADVISKYSIADILYELNLYIDTGEDLFKFIRKNKKEINKIRYAALKKAINKEEWADVERISSLNVYELLKFSYYKSIHEEISFYDEPFFYEIFDLSRQGVPIILLDASFDEKLFRLMYGRYAYEESKQPRSLVLGKELGSLKEVKIKIYQSNLKNKERKIYRMDKDNYYYKRGFFGLENELTESGVESIEKLRRYIQKTKRKHPNVGIITYKSLTKYFVDIGKTDYFFNLRGSNELERCDVLYIIGTPQTNPIETVKEYNKLTMGEISPKDTYRRTYKKKDGVFEIYDPTTGESFIRIRGEGKEKIPDPIRLKETADSKPLTSFSEAFDEGEIDLDVYCELPYFDEFKSESEQYQALHRARPLLNLKEIYVFGNIPKKIKEEFKIIPVDKRNTEAYFMGSRFIGIYPLNLWIHITNFYSETEATSKEIAEKLKIYKKDKKGYNTSFITDIIKGEVSLQEIMKIDKSIKSNPEITAKAIKREYRTLKANDEFIEYCIFYANKGNFID